MMSLPNIVPAGRTRSTVRLRGLMRSPALGVLLLLLSAVAGFAQTQVGSLPATQPTYVAIDTDATGTRWLYVSQHGEVTTDGTVPTNGGVILKYNLTTGSTTPIPITTHGTGNGQFISPDGIVIDPKTHDLFVADRYLSRIQRLHSDGSYVMQWGTPTSGAPDEMHGPSGLAMDASGAIYVAEHGDTTNPPFGAGGQHVSKYVLSGTGSSATATRVWRIGSYGGGNGQFNSTGPYGVVVNGNTILVADAFNQRVETFDLNGNYVSQFGLAGGAEPLGLDLTSSGDLWIAETSSYDGSGPLQQFQKYSPAGSYAGVTLTATPAFSLPFDAAIDRATNKAYLSDYNNNRIVIVDLSDGTTPKPVVSNASVSGAEGAAITPVTVSATNSPTTFTADGLIPYGLSINDSGVISGTPTATANNVAISVTATNAGGQSAPATITLNISGAAPAAPVVTNTTVTATYGAAIAPVTVPATNSPTSFDANGLTAYGLSISSSGVITGTPTAIASDIKIPVTATNAYGTSQEAIITLDIAPDPSVPVGPSVTSFSYVAHSLKFEIAFSEPVSGVDMNSFVFTQTGNSTGHFDSVTKIDDSHYELNFTFYSGAPGTFVFDIKPSGSNIVGLNSGRPYIGAGITKAIVPVTPHLETDAPVVTAFDEEGVWNNTAYFVVHFNKESWNVQSSNVSINTTGSATGTIGDIVPTDDTAMAFTIPVTFSGSGTVSLTLSNATQQTISDGNYNMYVGPNTSDVFTLPTNTGGGGGTPSAPVVSNATVSGTVGTAITPVTVSATNSPTSFSAPGLATYGLSISSTGVISGTPGTAANNVAVSVTASNAGGTSAPATITLNLAASTSGTPSAPVVSNASVSGTVGTAITPVTVSATNSPTSFSAPGLATYGLSISSTGVISGTPGTAANNVAVSVTASNAGGTSAPATITLNLAASTSGTPSAPVVSNATVSGTVGTAITPVTVSATNSPTSFSAPGLATYGLSISSTGVISGTPGTAANNVAVSVTASNAGGTSAPATITLNLAASTPGTPSAPVVSNATVSGTVGTAITPVTVSATNSPTSFSAPGLATYGLSISSTGVISGTPGTAANNVAVSVTAANAGGTSAPATITLNLAAQSGGGTPPPPPPPVLTPQTITFVTPTGSLLVDHPIALGATTTSGLPITYSVVSGPGTVSGDILTISGTTPVTVRAYQAGNSTYASASAEVTITATRENQVIDAAPVPPAVHTDHTLALPADASSGLPITYSVVSGPATVSGNTLTFTGSGTVVLQASQPGSAIYAPTSTTITVTANPVPRLINISSRAEVSAHDAQGATIAGFVVTGTTPKQVLIRAIGPGLAAYGVTDPLPDPTLRLYDSKGTLIATNSGWNNDPKIAAADAGTGAFPLTAGSKDAALLVTLAPGAYTAQVASADHSGTALVEVYDVAANAAVPTKQLINISTRAVVGTDGTVIGGFVVSGDEPKHLLIRAVGPGLATYGVSGVLSDPMLKVYDSKGVVVAQNDNWGTQESVSTAAAGGASGVSTSAADITSADSASGAFPLQAGSTDAAVTATVAPGAYTVVVTGANHASGNVLMEVYEVPTN